MNVASGGKDMTVIPAESMDNGDGTTTILTDWYMGDDVSADLGYKSVTVKAGTYPIDFSNPTTYPFGRATFSVNTIP